MIRAVLFDLDGVVRHFDPAHVASIERRHALAAPDGAAEWGEHLSEVDEEVLALSDSLRSAGIRTARQPVISPSASNRSTVLRPSSASTDSRRHASVPP